MGERRREESLRRAFRRRRRPRIAATDAIEFRSATSIVLRCGDSVISMLPDGIEMDATKFRFHIDGATVLLKEKKVRLAADTAILIKSDKIAAKSSGASIKLTDKAEIGASAVKVKSATDDVDDLDDATTQKTKIQLNDSDGNPIPGARYVLVMERWL